MAERTASGNIVDMEKNEAAAVRPRTAAATRRLGIGAVSIATVVWASGSILAKWNTMTGLHFAAFRLWAGVAVSFTALAVTRRRLRWPTFRACALGGVFFASDIALHFSSVKRTSIANASLIGALAPVVIAFVSTRLLGERISRRDALLIAASFVGVAVVAIGGSGSPAWSPFGDFLAFCGVGTWAAYWFFSRRAREGSSSIEYFASVMLAGAIVITPIALVLEGVPAMPELRDWVAVWAVALFPGFVGHTLVIWSHRHVESWLSALITQCSPVIAAGLAWIFLNEAVEPLAALGGAIVIAATATVIAGAAKREALADMDAASERAG